MISKTKTAAIVATLTGATVCLAVFLVLFAGRERSKRERMTCASNLRQIGQAIGMYVADNDGYMPGLKQWNHGTIPSLPHTGCPAAEPVPQITPPLPDTKHKLPGYAFNQGLMDKSVLVADKWISKQLPYTALTHPRSTIAVFDYTSGIASTAVLDFYKMTGSSWPKRLPQGWKRHGGGGNYLFCDGHVAWFMESQLLTTEPDICDGDKTLPTFCVDNRNQPRR